VSESDRRDLEEFFRRLDGRLIRGIGVEHAPQLFPAWFAATFHEAWNSREGTYYEAVGYLRDPTIDLVLEEHGLAGAELEIKLRGFNISLTTLEQRLAVVLESPPGRRRGRPTWTAVRKRFGRSLRWADIPLGSYGEALKSLGAGVLLEPVKELKEAAEAALEHRQR
jgi:hypothetical protein